MAFYVGQKVVCVDDSPSDKVGRRLYSVALGRQVLIGSNLTGLSKGAIYTVSGLGVAHEGEPAIHVAEISRTVPFRQVRFRPVVERKTSIEVFEKLLNPSHEEVSA